MPLPAAKPSYDELALFRTSVTDILVWPRVDGQGQSMWALKEAVILTKGHSLTCVEIMLPYKKYIIE